MRAEIIHIWAATAGEPPTSPAGHTPLSADTYDGAVNELAELQKPVPTDAPHLYRLIANMASRIRTDEVTFYYQLIATMESTWREPGDKTSETFCATRLPSKMDAVVMISRYDEFVQLPMATWSIGCPATSRTVLTTSGMCGRASNGSSAARSMS